MGEERLKLRRCLKRWESSKKARLQISGACREVVSCHVSALGIDYDLFRFRLPTLGHKKNVRPCMLWLKSKKMSRYAIAIKAFVAIIFLLQLSSCAAILSINQTTIELDQQPRGLIGAAPDPCFVDGDNSLLILQRYRQPSTSYNAVLGFLHQLDRHISDVISSVPGATRNTEWPGRKLSYTTIPFIQIELAPEDHHPPYPFTLRHVTEFQDDLNEWIVTAGWRPEDNVPSADLVYIFTQRSGSRRLDVRARGRILLGEPAEMEEVAGV